jgi:hypothetical protein
VKSLPSYVATKRLGLAESVWREARLVRPVHNTARFAQTGAVFEPSMPWLKAGYRPSGRSFSRRHPIVSTVRAMAQRVLPFALLIFSCPAVLYSAKRLTESCGEPRAATFGAVVIGGKLCPRLRYRAWLDLSPASATTDRARFRTQACCYGGLWPGGMRC